MSRQYTLQRAPRSSSIHIDYPSELNEQQLAAVTASPGPLLVIAGAGSGKTRTLTYRVAYLLENGIDPRNILLLTFTNKAARQMLDRVAGGAERVLDRRDRDVDCLSRIDMETCRRSRDQRQTPASRRHLRRGWRLRCGSALRFPLGRAWGPGRGPRRGFLHAATVAVTGRSSTDTTRGARAQPSRRRVGVGRTSGMTHTDTGRTSSAKQSFRTKRTSRPGPPPASCGASRSVAWRGSSVCRSPLRPSVRCGSPRRARAAVDRRAGRDRARSQRATADARDPRHRPHPDPRPRLARAATTT